MVKMFNIKVVDNLISCDYSPEDSDKIGSVSVDINTQEVTDIKFSDYEYGKKMYVAHVRSKLLELLRSSPLPNTAVAVWY